ncbi:hypothetical protein [Longispora albida]|uniref:hypothetical protein n=1 Tax=Longispora albida TaxID=203523 RepID=UPI0003A211DB|nr:hypothetical protein [Longispora albida]
MRTRSMIFPALLVAALALTGCGGVGGADDALAKVKVPDWFTEPSDKTEDGKFVRTYLKLPKSGPEAEVAYAQALDRAGWKFHDEGPVCGKKAAKEGCWTGSDLLVTFKASANDGRADTVVATTLTVVVSAGE